METKKCTNCGEEKLIEDFISKNGKELRQCPQCRRSKKGKTIVRRWNFKKK